VKADTLAARREATSKISDQIEGSPWRRSEIRKQKSLISAFPISAFQRFPKVCFGFRYSNFEFPHHWQGG
jgi:hypothetical protein